MLTFKAYDGTLIRGTIVARVGKGVYLVAGETICTTYSDGLYRFTERDIVK